MGVGNKIKVFKVRLIVIFMHLLKLDRFYVYVFYQLD